MILAEEVGEVMQEINEVHFRHRSTINLETELIQVMAVCMSYLEHVHSKRVLPMSDSEFGDG